MAHEGEVKSCHVGGGELGSAAFACAPDLILLREAAMREKHAVLTYYRFGRALSDRRLADLFREEAKHQAGHLVSLCRAIARLDPEQAEEFRHHDLGYLVSGAPEWRAADGHAHHGKAREAEDGLAAVQEAIDLELHTLNMYQEEALRASEPEVKELFVRIMNHEKEDLALFLRELHRLLHPSR